MNNSTILATKNINDNLDLRILLKIIELLKIKDLEKDTEKIDYLQVFEVKNNILVNKQEKPENRLEIQMNINSKLELKIFAIRDIFKDKKIWTIMFADEY